MSTIVSGVNDYDDPETIRFRKYATGAHRALRAGEDRRVAAAVEPARFRTISVRVREGAGRDRELVDAGEGEAVQYQEFIERVQRRADLGSFEGAEEATRATLSTLGEYLVDREGLDLAAQLPQGLAELLRREPPDRAGFFSLNDFLQEVGEREGINEDEARAHAKAVMGVLEEAVSEGEMDDVRRQFPSEFDPLFDRP